MSEKVETAENKQGKCLELYIKYLEECYIADCVIYGHNYIVKTYRGGKITLPAWQTAVDLAGTMHVDLEEAEALLNMLKRKCRQPTPGDLMRYVYWREGLTLYKPK